MNPIKDLVNEHSLIRMMLAVLKGMDEKIIRDEKVETQDLMNAMAFLGEFADKCHHSKEEKFLFPMMRKNGIKEETELMDILIGEHAEGREYIKNMAEAIGKRKRNEKKFAERFISNSQRYIHLLDRHIATENGILFPQAEHYLSEDELRELEEGFEKTEMDAIGIGRHEELHEMLRKLKETYAGMHA
jgi:hemerythrin-like domain-containing protein